LFPFAFQVGIVATKDNTVIKYTIPVSQGVRLTYNGVTYGDNQTLTINMNAYQVILFQYGNDLSGSRIVSNFPVAVFSGIVHTIVLYFIGPNVETAKHA
jgi:hypothetical protein